MKTTLKIDGMMCEACSGKIAEALKGVDGVSDVKVNLGNGTAVVLGNDFSDEILVEAVVNAGFAAKVKRGLFGR